MGWTKSAGEETRFRNGCRPGPGRPRLTTEEKIKRKVLREYYKDYLTNGDAVKDFERLRRHDPSSAIDKAERAHAGLVSPEVHITITQIEGGGDANLKKITLDTDAVKEDLRSQLPAPGSSED